MNHELLLFFCSMGTGAGLLFCYDWIRIARKLIRHSPPAVSVVDLLYWIMAGILIFAVMYCQNDGIIRSYAMLGIVVGMAVYHRIVGENFVRFMVAAIKFPIKILKKPVKRLIFVIGRCNITLRRACRRLESSIGKRYRFIWKKGFMDIEKKKKCRKAQEK